MRAPIALFSAVAMVAMAGSGVTRAADLVNQDGRSYAVKIHDVGTTNSSIGANTTQTGICSACRIEVEGAGSVEITSSDRRVTISGGSLSKE